MPETEKRGRGRPAAFNRAVVLKEAMKLFWEQGYEGTSFNDLITGMGISPSTFNSTFGSKENLYREATSCFVKESGLWFQEALDDKALDTREAFAKLFDRLAHEFTRKDMPHGCMISLSGTHHSPKLESIRSLMTEHRAATEQRFLSRIRAGIDDGDVPAETDIEGLAAYANTVVRGLAVQARDGASRNRLREIAKIATKAWPHASLEHANGPKDEQRSERALGLSL